MKIALLSILSEIHDEERINDSLKDKYQFLNNNFEITEIAVDEVADHDFSDYDLTINFIKSGGSEKNFARIFEYLPQPVYLYAVELHNSLPAALEILSFVNARGAEAKILHGENEDLLVEIKELIEYRRIRNKISEAKIGVIGKPSDWLIGSQVDREHAAQHWGTEFIDIEMEEVYSALKNIEQKEAEKVAEQYFIKAEKMLESSKADLIKAAEIYLALKKLAVDYDLDALTIRCFDLVEKINNTGCLALALLNDEGITAGCEGDIAAVFTMYLAAQLTGETPFMANPVKIDSKKDQINFAHCTVPLSISEKFILRSHFETGIGVGIQGILRKEAVTVFKIGGAGLEQYFVAEGKIIENMNSQNACRTQIKVELPQSSDYFLSDAIANHHLIIAGHHAAKINHFLAKE
ncbi:L-fucose isomerase-like protein [Halanaerobium hydrogeniformans]|uniref:L-fucose isomerase-like protein n=2 Tax=Halanaerobium hydrogeniformans TaxID=656519 RepID=E4RN11_HALHG|nr:L-fucose isomerase-like protein [Halanaerobium hydrogeniformans]